MADMNRTNLGETPTPQADHAADHKTPSWLEGLPHNFDGWGPKTPDTDAPEEMLHADSELTWTGQVDDRNHHVWSFRRAGRRHH